MRVKYYINLLFLFSFSVVHAQDLIVKTTGDSLNCKIKKINHNYIHYEFNAKQAVLSSSQIKSYQKDFYKKTTQSAVHTTNEVVNLKGFRLGIYGGWSYLVGKVDKSLPSFLYNYNKELKSGYHLGADFGYFFKSGMGVGIKYSRFATKNKYDGKVYIIDSITNKPRVGDLMDDITIQYFGPAYMSRLVHKKTGLEILCDVSIGYFMYKDIAVAVDKFIITSGTIGTSLNIGITYPIVKNLHAGIDCSLYRGTLFYYQYDDGRRVNLNANSPNKPSSISRIDLSATIKCFF